MLNRHVVNTSAESHYVLVQLTCLQVLGKGSDDAICRSTYRKCSSLAVDLCLICEQQLVINFSNAYLQVNTLIFPEGNLLIVVVQLCHFVQ